MAFWNQHATPPISTHAGAETMSFFGGLELLDPGLVSCSHWRQEFADIDGPAPHVPQYGAVGRKP